jgi:hypothetical protein
MTLSASSFFLFSNLDGTTIILGALAIVTAIISTYTSILESKDKRKHFLGMNVKDVKRIAAYCSFILTILTLIVQDKHDSDTKLEAVAKERKADSIQRKNLDTTLISIGKTLAAQHVALDSTDTILNRQKSQLAYQVTMLRKQQQALDSNTKIISREGSIYSGVQNSIGLMHNTLDSEIQALAVERRTDTSVQSLKFPMLNNFGLVCTIRFYTKGETELWKPGANLSGVIYHYMTDIRPFLNNNVKGMDFNEQRPLRVFFNNMVSNAMDRQFLVNYQIGGHPGEVAYDQQFGYDYTSFDGITIPYEISYNPQEHYFASDGDYGCGGIKSNKGNIESFNALINHAKLYIKFRYTGPKNFDLPGYNNKHQVVTVDHVSIADMKAIKYGSALQYKIDLNKNNAQQITDKKIIKMLWNEDIDDKELWRYCVVQISLNKAAP